MLSLQIETKISKFGYYKLKFTNKNKVRRNKVMKLKLLLATIVATMLCGCAEYNRLLKSDDAVAKYEAGMDFYKNKKYERAKAMFESAIPALIGTAYEDTTLYTLGKLLYETKDFEMAGETMDQYRNKFPRSSKTPEAEYIYAMSFYKIAPDVERDQSATRRAISAFVEYLNRHPESPFVPEIHTMIEELHNKLYHKKYMNAALYYKLGHFQSAITSLRAIIKESPETPYKEEIMYLICKSWFDYARNSVYARQLDRFLKTIDAYYNFITAFPESKKFGRELEKMKNIAQDFVDKNGVTSQMLETSATKIEDAKAKIEDYKDKLFYVKTKEEKTVLRQGIKESREIIKIERKKMRIEGKVMNENAKVERKKIKEMETEEKAAKKAADIEKSEEKKKKREEQKQTSLQNKEANNQTTTEQ